METRGGNRSRPRTTAGLSLLALPLFQSQARHFWSWVNKSEPSQHKLSCSKKRYHALFILQEFQTRTWHSSNFALWLITFTTDFVSALGHSPQPQPQTGTLMVFPDAPLSWVHNIYFTIGLLGIWLNTDIVWENYLSNQHISVLPFMFFEGFKMLPSISSKKLSLHKITETHPGGMQSLGGINSLQIQFCITWANEA